MKAGHAKGHLGGASPGRHSLPQSRQYQPWRRPLLLQYRRRGEAWTPPVRKQQQPSPLQRQLPLRQSPGGTSGCLPSRPAVAGSWEVVRTEEPAISPVDT